MTSGYYRTSSPVTALPMITRLTSDVPSKIVKLVEVRAVSTGRWPLRRALDPVYADFSARGTPAGIVCRTDLVTRIATALSGFTATQHISPNHVIDFDTDDPSRAICHSYMYVQHLLAGSENGDFFLLRGSYTNHMVRTADGWRIERIIQHQSWDEGNTTAVAEAIERFRGQAGTCDSPNATR